MNTFYNQVFNPQFINPTYYSQVQYQVPNYEFKQDQKVIDAGKAMHDLLSAISGMDQKHQEQAFMLCLSEIAQHYNW